MNESVFHVLVGAHRQRTQEQVRSAAVWFDLRHKLLCGEWDVRIVKDCLEAATVCDHPEAVWLTKLFAGGSNVETFDGFWDVLTDGGDEFARCYAAILGVMLGTKGERWLEEVLIQCAIQGLSTAQVFCAQFVGLEDTLKWAVKGAEQLDREGFLWMGFCFNYGYNCKASIDRAHQVEKEKKKHVV
jgi:hypothetical protein